jgi:ArsR family transcriptional regulator, lead/cadmium/zinc/bismuth-responsive transcriptional repressor
VAFSAAQSHLPKSSLAAIISACLCRYAGEIVVTRPASLDALLSLPTLSAPAAEFVAQTFGALADPTRARILFALTKGEYRVNDLAELAGISPSATSHQLRLLRDRRLVRYRRAGRELWYTVDDAHVGTLFREALHHLAHVLYGLPDHPSSAVSPTHEGASHD